MKQEVSFHMFLKKMTPNYLEKEKFQVIMRKKKAPVEFVSKVDEYYHQFFYQAIEVVVNCIYNRF